MDKEIIFALDIGTRKVMGIVARKADESSLEILDAEILEHPARPMLDGQIQNIEDASRTVKKIKLALEARLNLKLEKVGVAVAGRNLLTYKSKISKPLEFAEEITPAQLKDWELEAVDKILSDPGKNIASNFYCAGYSPIYYELDGNKLSNPCGHRGKNISCEIIVTLLPKVVLNSMFSVLKIAGLVPTNVTLEPIAAINAIVPAEIRNLNILLVDIGAGTSDLALTKDGFVYAYGMVPLAGDEITECICQALLTDFLTAEEIKRSLNKNTRLTYEDIWTRKHELEPRELTQKIAPAVNKLAEAIAREAGELISSTPQAIILVGGGSLTFGLLPELARSFSLSADKIGIRLPQTIKTVKNLPPKLNSAEAVTPLGIALMTADSRGLSFIEVEVNGKKVKMLDFKQKKDILGALTLAEEIHTKKLYPKPGMALSYYLNGELKFARGSLGCPAKTTVNGKPMESLSQKLNPGDKITFEPAIDGENARPAVRDVLNLEPADIRFNQETLRCLPAVTVNNQAADLDGWLMDRADIRILPLKIKDVLSLKSIDLNELFERQILVNINDHPRVLTQTNFSLRLNGCPGNLEAVLKSADTIEFSLNQPTHYKIKDVLNIPEPGEKLHIEVDGKNIELECPSFQVFMNGRQVNPEEFLIDGAQIKIYSLKKRAVILSEIFRHIDFNPRQALGKEMKILVDDMPAGFTTPLTEGSRVRILFENREGSIL